jgi:hypothetical protein
MRRSKGGRPSKVGQRTKSGQLSRAGKRFKGLEEPNAKVLEAREAFRWFRGGKAVGEIHDPIGRAWAAGLLDGETIAADKLRDAARGYGEDYWGFYRQLAPAMVDLEPERRGSGARKPTPGEVIAEDPHGEWFAALDATLLRAGREVRNALHSVAVDQYWFPTEGPAWLDRLIMEKRLALRAELVLAGRLPDTFPGIVGELPRAGDAETLAALLRALRVLVTGRVGMLVGQGEAVEAEVEVPVPVPPVHPTYLDDDGRMLSGPGLAAVIRERFAAQDEPECQSNEPMEGKAA